ncbi:hypothetical protein CLIB1423_05S03862 [[Candida] railenensis]|uniref:Uncharacterized protein n=1 Tax=[Candida] railenensis TaxID=45579 RepID=A0A9P0QNV6_9ASCO|nr:hypothetical protein CLIB1423_05S03862 [[Candida] railenensis]
MVTLFELSQRQQEGAVASLDSGIPVLDTFLPRNIANGGIFDIHAVPGCSDQFEIVCNFICTHLQKDPRKQIIIIDTLHPFPFHKIRQNKNFDTSMAKRISWYNAGTFSKLYALLEQLNHREDIVHNSMVIINNFQELIDFYKMEISYSYEQMLLKHQIEVNNVLLANEEKIRQEGSFPVLPIIPPNSDLLKENPQKKFNSHISTISNLLSSFVRNYSSIFLLLGYLDTQYEQQENNASNSSVSSQSFMETQSTTQSMTQSISMKKPRKLVLAPKPTPLDKFIICRLIFFKYLDANGIEVGVKVQNYKEDRAGEVNISAEYLSDNEQKELDELDEEREKDLARATYLPSSPELSESQVDRFRSSNNFNLQPTGADNEQSNQQRTPSTTEKGVPVSVNANDDMPNNYSDPANSSPLSEIPDSQGDVNESQVLYNSHTK